MFSDGTTGLLACLRDRGRSAFPSHWTHKRLGTHSIHEWFTTIVDQELDGEPQRCATEPNVGLLIVLQCNNAREITYLNAHALATVGGDLTRFYLDPKDIEPHYFRLDYDPTGIGPIFKEPFPHFHVVLDEGPRFPFAFSGNVVVDLLDFLYRNFARHQWDTWAMETWRRYRLQHNIPDEDDRYERIDAAFKTSNIEQLVRMEEQVRLIKQAWRESLDSAFAPRVNHQRCTLLSFP